MVPRVIRLRRPVVLSVQEGRFVPERGAALLDDIDARWDALCSANPAYHDGAVYHVLGVHRNGHGGASVHVIESSYRFQAVQTPAAGSGSGETGDFDVGHRGLGVRGIVRLGGDGKVLLGRRSQHVGRYPGMWEFAPAGGLPLGAEPASALLDELREETGLESSSEPIAVAVMFDDVARTWEIVFAIAAPSTDVRCATGEYSELAWFGPMELPAELSHMTSMMKALLRD